MLCTACHNAGHHEDAHGHSHGEAHSHEGHSHEAHSHEGHEHETTAHITIYGGGYEIFTESEPFVAGEETVLLVHITSLSDFKPYEGKSLSASIISGGKENSHGLHTTAAKGIYKTELTVASEGDATIKFNVDGAELSSTVTVYHCEHDAEAAMEEASSSNGVKFTKEQSWMVDFATEECRRESVGQVIRTVGQILPSQGSTRIITAKASGIVTIAGGSLLAGSPVRKDAALLYIGSEGLADSNMDVRYAEARSEYERAAGEYERKSRLAEDKIVSQSDLSQARTEYEVAKATFENLEKNYRDGRFAASSDIDGYLTELYVSNGEYVQAGDRLAAVCNDSRLLVEAKVQPKWHKMLQRVDSANFKFYGDDRTWSLEELSGRLASVGRSTSTESPLLPVSFEIANRPGLLPGTFADIYIKTSGDSETLTVASGAVVEEMGSYFVYRQINPEYFEKVQVRAGASDGRRTEILAGLEEGQRVVSRGAVIVKLAQAAGGLDAHSGHAH